ncbi:hypothetical protein [Sphingopyxis sp. NJF-3]
MSRKDRADSRSSAVTIAQGSARTIEPPVHVPLDECDWPFWNNVVSEFARAQWTDHQLEIAAMLARTMANLESEQRSLRSEGFVAVRANGTTVENPRSRVVKGLAGDILSLRRSLALHARAKSGDNRDAAKQRDVGRGMEVSLDDDLIARPRLQ